MMISWPNTAGLRTSTTASRMIFSRSGELRPAHDGPVSHDVLDHDHRAVDDDSKVDRAQAEQRAGDAQPHTCP